MRVVQDRLCAGPYARPEDRKVRDTRLSDAVAAPAAESCTIPDVSAPLPSAHRVSRPVALVASLLLATALGACDKGSTAPAEPAEPPTSATPDVEPAPETPPLASVETQDAPEGRGEEAASDGEPAVEASAGEASPGASEPAEPEKPATKPKPKAKPGLPSPIFGKGNSSCGRDPGVGQPIKSFSLETTTGKTISSGKLKGRVVLLNFWGTWCKPCLKELPEFDRLYRRYRKNGLVLLAIATDSDPEPVKALAKERRLAAKIAIGGEELANSYKSPSFPFSFVVDENGIIQASYRGFKPECLGQLEQDIRKQLAAD